MEGGRSGWRGIAITNGVTTAILWMVCKNENGMKRRGLTNANDNKTAVCMDVMVICEDKCVLRWVGYECVL